MPSPSSKPSRGRARRWLVSSGSKKSKTILLTFRKSRKRLSSVTLSKWLSSSLRQCFVLSLLTLHSELTTTTARQVLNSRLQRIRTTRSLTSAYSLWLRTFSEYSSPTDGSFGFLALPGMKGLSLHFVELDSLWTKCLSSGIVQMGGVIRRDQTG